MTTTREEIDTLWHQALQESVKAGEQFTRYHFAALVADAETKRADALAAVVAELRDVVTSDAESKSDFIARVCAVLEACPDQRVLHAVAVEREACAKVCDDADKSTHPADLAEAIRARRKHMKTVIEMAREAKLPEAWISETGVLKWSDLERFAEIARADAIAQEREACAQLCETFGPGRPIVATRPSERVIGRWEGEQAASGSIAAAIRARGITPASANPQNPASSSP